MVEVARIHWKERCTMKARGVGPSSPGGEVVVLGLGNLLRRDEGLGIRALERLRDEYTFPERVRLVDGGTLGLDLISHVEGAEYLLVLDAMLTDGPPGSLLRLAGSDVPAFFGVRMSHDVGLADLLAILMLRDSLPRELVVLGMQPGVIELGWELSPEVEGQLDALVAAAVSELRRWGAEVQKLTTESTEHTEGQREGSRDDSSYASRSAGSSPLSLASVAHSGYRSDSYA
jgi:hydrogenase maturation protease